MTLIQEMGADCETHPLNIEQVAAWYEAWNALLIGGGYSRAALNVWLSLRPSVPCERPGCDTPTTGDLLYCSDECYDADNDPTPITVVARNKAGGFGRSLHWQTPDAVHLHSV